MSTPNESGMVPAHAARVLADANSRVTPRPPLNSKAACQAALAEQATAAEILRCEQLMEHARYAVFVFGSNAEGLHVGGAARHAWKAYGAKLGVGEGRTGRCYALPTMARLGAKPDMRAVEEAVERFFILAKTTPRTTYAVTRVGCGIAGIDEDDMALLFADAPANCALPLDWRTDADEEVAEYIEGRLG